MYIDISSEVMEAAFAIAQERHEKAIKKLFLAQEALAGVEERLIKKYCSSKDLYYWWEGNTELPIFINFSDAPRTPAVFCGTWKNGGHTQITVRLIGSRGKPLKTTRELNWDMVKHISKRET